MAERYNVVFEYTEASGGRAGIRTWTSFSSKEAFQKSPRRDTKKVIAEGVSDDEAKRLCAETPITSRINAAFAEATRPDGSISPIMLEIELANAEASVALDLHEFGRVPPLFPRRT